MTSDEDKRAHPRFEMRGKVRYRIPEQMEISMASIKNVSAGGLCLLTENQLNAGLKLSLEFTLPGAADPILCAGKVRWTENLDVPQGNFNHRIGIEFSDIDDEKQKKINKFVVNRLKSQIHEEVQKSSTDDKGGKAAPITMLVVDDDRVTLNLIKDIFGDDFNVLTADNGHKGVDMAREWRPDIILLDIIMPDMDGFSTLMLLKDFPETADIPVIMLSVVRDKNKVFQAIQHGAKDYMIKPFTSETLLYKINKIGLKQD